MCLCAWGWRLGHHYWSWRLRSADFAFGDLPQVAHREDDPSAVHVEGHLPAVGASPERTLGHVGEAEVAEDLGRRYRREDLRQCERVRIMDGHATPTGLQGLM